jgi:hypothetical protein
MLECARKVMAGTDLGFCRVDRGRDLELVPNREGTMDLTRAGDPRNRRVAKKAGLIGTLPETG